MLYYIQFEKYVTDGHIDGLCRRGRRCAHFIIFRKGVTMSLASDLIRGNTETIILAQLMKHDSYGYQINKTIQEKTNHEYELKEATLYSAFRRLEEAGHISSYWGNEETGARRRYYTITTAGRENYRQRIGEWEKSREIIDILTRLD